VTEYLRLLGATALVLLPGRLIACSLGSPGASATLAWGLAAIFVAWAVTFVVHGTITLALVFLGVIGVAFALGSLSFGRPLLLPRREGGRGTGWLVLAGGTALGIALWHVAGPVTGDGLFHLARIRKLLDLGHLHLRTVDEFRDGGLHPGYAFPLWHGFEAMVAKVSGLDPAIVVRHEASVLAPLACLVAWEAGVALFGSATGGLAVLAGQLGLYVFAAGHGGSWVSLTLPATAARQILLPAALALFFGFLESRRWPDAGALAAAFGALALVHVTYAVFALIPLAAYALVRLGEWGASAVALAAAALPAGLVVLWVRPLANETLSRNPTAKERAAELAKYGDQLDVWSLHRFRITPELLGRAGPVAVAGLLLVPLAALAARRRWSAFVLGGTVAILALMLVPTLFVRFSDATSLSQARRAAGFVPFAYALAGGLALLGRTRLVLPAALAAGILAERQWPGDFVYGLRHGGPALATWVAFVGGIAGIVVGLVWFRRRDVREWPARAAVAAALFVLPIAVHGFRRWTPLTTTDAYALSPAVRAELRRVPAGAVVIASPQISYGLAAAAPVYVVAAPPPHVANTRANRPYARVRDVQRWLATGDPAVLRRYHPTWAVKHGRLYRLAR
jgi:hypothetical protein